MWAWQGSHSALTSWCLSWEVPIVGPMLWNSARLLENIQTERHTTLNLSSHCLLSLHLMTQLALTGPPRGWHAFRGAQPPWEQWATNHLINLPSLTPPQGRWEGLVGKSAFAKPDTWVQSQNTHGGRTDDLYKYTMAHLPPHTHPPPTQTTRINLKRVWTSPQCKNLYFWSLFILNNVIVNNLEHANLFIFKKRLIC